MDCLTCGDQIDLRDSGTPGTLLAQRPRLCRECLRLRPRGRWCLSPSELAERDGPNCSICCDVVDLTVVWPEPLSPSVDHRVPRSLGGQDEPSNVALAHLRCNISKGIRAPA
ncbi:HNH endonuclease [Streptomyces sp. NPDC090077]|uniref:HNH endonuclease n=1 Tax=Streptomyces sp. NPDC090077 TaxID=3365938 RepID=UPI0037FBA716